MYRTLNICVASEISLLVPDFRKQLLRSLEAAKKINLHIEVHTTVITPQEQAALWKQGRTKTDAELKTLALKNANAHYLAECMRQAVPQETNRITNLLPGHSWSQWGEAASMIWIDGSHKINWTAKVVLGANGYKKFADILKEFFLHSGGEFEDTDDAWRYVQLRPERLPSDVFNLEYIDAEMKRRFGGRK